MTPGLVVIATTQKKMPGKDSILPASSSSSHGYQAIPADESMGSSSKLGAPPAYSENVSAPEEADADIPDDL